MLEMGLSSLPGLLLVMGQSSLLGLLLEMGQSSLSGLSSLRLAPALSVLPYHRMSKRLLRL
jgi:hypothetical protein